MGILKWLKARIRNEMPARIELRYSAQVRDAWGLQQAPRYLVFVGWHGNARTIQPNLSFSEFKQRIFDRMYGNYDKVVWATNDITEAFQAIVYMEIQWRKRGIIIDTHAGGTVEMPYLHKFQIRALAKRFDMLK